MTALTTQAITAVPVPVDIKWILMESLALVRNMTKQNIFTRRVRLATNYFFH